LIGTSVFIPVAHGAELTAGFFTSSSTHISTSHDLWDHFKRASLETNAMFLEWFSDWEIFYFLRDMEYTYQNAVQLTDGDIEAQERIHPINVSRSTKHSELLLKYVEQMGITEEALKKGKKFLLVDSCCHGNMPYSVKTLFGHKYKDQIQILLLTSQTPVFPGIDLFLGFAYKMEMLPHRDMSAIGYKLGLENKIEIITGPSADDGSPSGKGRASLEDAASYVDDMQKYSSDPRNVDFFKSRRKLWRNLKEIFQGKGKELAQNTISGFLKSEDPYENALYRDFLMLSGLSIRASKQNSSSLDPCNALF